MVKKKIWGNITWYLFHTLSYKLKYDNEENIKNLFKIIKDICNNLPCVICKNHANVFLSRVNYNNLKTKENLINLMFIFHNEVNEKNNTSIFTKNQHDDLYKKANTSLIIKYFIKIWSFKEGYIGVKQNNFSKELCLKNFKSYISKNRYLFD
tara:strand:+ start:3518 stop:3973 length:456 start_codon:yes stop_codon:yes gene_type:complete